MICILEDDPQRVKQFLEHAGVIAPGVPVRVWQDAHAMLAEFAEVLDRVALISLDHDLRQQGGTDPGSGYDIAKVLGELIPCCPVIIHTSNAERGTWMEGELSRGGWQYERVYPFGDRWIELEWAPLVGRLLKR